MPFSLPTALAAATAIVPGVSSPAPDPMCANPVYRCPDLVMASPYDLSIVRRRGRVLLRAANSIFSLGRGPLKLYGWRIGRTTMRARQIIYTSGGSVTRPTHGGKIVWKAIPGQGHYWKFQDAARFELWTVGENRRRVKVGPKVVYCFRDLRRTHPSSRSPRDRVNPACSQDFGRRRVELGTSIGWADIYPATYHEQWIDVTGRRGCFALWHIADPYNHIIESNEANNAASTMLRLPWRGRVGRC
ncbi:MAG: hypothetical protein JHC95_16915 [Solirubrobacteraceae bacterium]|nr:hypothetical protein [Solirubrobacteraceae bacterium]